MSLDHTDRIRRLVLATPKRRLVFETIHRDPGIHVRRLSRRTGLALGSVEHHLRVLDRHGLVFSHRDGRRRTWYASDGVQNDDVHMLHALAKPPWRTLMAALLHGDEAGVSTVAQRAEMSRSQASYHLGRMRDAGLVDQIQVGRENVYYLQDPQRFLRLTRPAEPGFEAVVHRAMQHAPETVPDVRKIVR